MGNDLLSDFDCQLVSRIMVGIGEAAEITNVPQRQIRYWEEKGYIQSLTGAGTTRRYDYATIKTIVLIKAMLDDGYVLEKAVEKIKTQGEAISQALMKLQKHGL